jgi:cytidine deaminase
MEKKIISTSFSFCHYEELPTEYRQLIDNAKQQTKKSYSPYSGFSVGAAVLLENGEIFSGSNQENAAYPSGLCAERTTLFYANAQRPKIPVKALAIAAFTKGAFLNEPIAPCGACRQVLLETENRFAKPIQILLYGEEGVFIIDSVKDLLPLSFTKESMA